MTLVKEHLDNPTEDLGLRLQSGLSQVACYLVTVLGGIPQELVKC